MITRKNIRLQDHDYSRDGAYFVTVCTKNKMCIFWENNDKYKPFTNANDNDENEPQNNGSMSQNNNTDKKINSQAPQKTNSQINSQMDSQSVGAAFRRPQISRKIRLSEYGRIVKNELLKIPSIYPDLIFIPKFVIMPNHIHLIIVINHDY
ncbi:MAG: hypothetical protein IJ779_03215, partial [Ruminococcus sp.]|nr:hypothetical protein [Ruminococcus sp.]